MRKLMFIAGLTLLLCSTAAAVEFDHLVLADAEGDGLISRDEFTAYYALVWLVYTGGKPAVEVGEAHPDVQAMIRGVLPQAAGMVHRDQLLDAVPAHYPAADVNQDGDVTLDEMREWKAARMTARPE